MTRIQDIAAFNEVREAGLAKLVPSKPRIGVGMGTCGSGNGAEAVLPGLRLRDRRPRPRRGARPGRLLRLLRRGAARQRLASRASPLLMLHRVQPEHVDQVLAGLGQGKLPPPELVLCKIEEWDHITGHVKYGQGFPELPHWNEVPFFKGQLKLVLRNCGLINPDDIEEYIAIGGYQALYKVLIDANPAGSHRAGRRRPSCAAAAGPASRPATSGSSCAQRRGPDEVPRLQRRRGRPRRLHEPQRDRERPARAARGHDRSPATRSGAAKGIVYVRAEYPLAVAAPRARDRAGPRLRRCSARTSSAAASSSTSSSSRAPAPSCAARRRRSSPRSRARRGVPRPRPPFPAEKGLWGKPTNINNVETWSNVAAHRLEGRRPGSARSAARRAAGTKVFSLVGKVQQHRPRRGAARARRCAKFVYDIGGGGTERPRHQGGPDRRPLRRLHPRRHVRHAGRLRDASPQIGSIMGSGGMVVMDDDNCMVDVARYFIEFTHSESLRQVRPVPGRPRQGTAHARTASPRARRRSPTSTRSTSCAAWCATPRCAASARPRPTRCSRRCGTSAHEFEDHIREQALPRRRVRGPGALPVRELLPAAHEHPALPAALQGRRARGRVPVRRSSTTRCPPRPGASASTRATTAAVAPRSTLPSTCATSTG